MTPERWAAVERVHHTALETGGRARTGVLRFPANIAEQLTFSGRTIDVPAQFIAGKQDWGANRIAGGPEAAGKTGYTKFRGTELVDRAGHWPHEEQPEIVSEQLIGFLKST
jgi:pimeloyl-ACP methyl ester carboxylesterase